MNRIAEHFEGVRKTLLALYADSTAASHTVVTGSLREGFIQALLQGHLPNTASWSSGQIVGHAPGNTLSGQLDIILHSGGLPQIFIHDGYLRLVPSDACIAVVEVKSEITTGKATNPKPTNVMAASLSSLAAATQVPRHAGNATPVPFHIIGYVSKVRAQKVVDFVFDYLSHKQMLTAGNWPDSIVVLRGAKKTEPEGYGVFKVSSCPRLPKTAQAVALKQTVNNLEIKKVLGHQALATFVSLLSKQAIQFAASTFQLEDYIYD